MVLGLPVGARQGALLVGIGLDQAGIDRKAFTTHQPLVQTALRHRLEQV